ncbi:hypothetical protein VNI00_002337 [Paramarasmius palmivorus]|uniref:AB hydrolase-1 domain-containing protein n=1 Tax=Paramarasmius palmivorus TaxID=297713 RepID=A0AAW0DXH6_9AGAR
MPAFSIESIIKPPDSSYPLHLTAKRYFLPDDSDPSGWTLFLLHATSSHKESWEPTIQKIFELYSKNKRKQKQGTKLREIWSLDCPNHGESGQLNERILQEPKWYLNFSCDKYAQAVHHFLTTGPVDFSARKLIGIGHSLGGNAISLVQSLASPSLKDAFKSLIIIEPMLSPAGPEHLKKLRLLLIKGAYERRDVWPDRDTAMLTLKKRDRTKKWDPRILDVFIVSGIGFRGVLSDNSIRFKAHGIRPHPGSFHKENPYPGVTLACTRDQEAAMYRDPDGATKPVEPLTQACKEKPVHLILAGVHDFMPKRTQEALLDPKSGRTFASVTIMPGVGHLVPLEVPDRLGEVIFDALVKNETLIPSRVKAKL